MRSRGFTLMEVLVGLALLGLLLSFVAGVQQGTLRLEARAREGHALAHRLASELRLQRALPAGTCHASSELPPGWTCRLVRTCLPAPPSCAVEVVSVDLASADGQALRGVTAVAASLRALPVEAVP